MTDSCERFLPRSEAQQARLCAESAFPRFSLAGHARVSRSAGYGEPQRTEEAWSGAVCHVPAMWPLAAIFPPSFRHLPARVTGTACCKKNQRGWLGLSGFSPYCFAGSCAPVDYCCSSFSTSSPRWTSSMAKTIIPVAVVGVVPMITISPTDRRGMSAT